MEMFEGKMNELFVEKYRPKVWEEMIGQEEIVREIRKGLEKNELPHLLFYGPPGVGKTTMALIIAKGIFKENFRSNFMELNSSDERGIATIKEKVKEFAKIQPLGSGFKIIFLDEADHLTGDAQACLRRIMEMYSRNTRFILSCNYLSKIISPIQSRCKVYRFERLGEGEICDYLTHIVVLTGRNKVIRDDVIKDIGSRCNGDLRMALNELQAVVGLGIDVKRLDGLEGNKMKEFWEEILKGNLLQSRGWIDKMLKEGKDDRRLIVEIREWVIKERSNSTIIDFPFDMKVILLELMKADERLGRGVESCLVWDGLCVELIK